MESDEDIFVLTSELLKRIKFEAKHSIKLAEDVTKHPGSLGAVHKNQALPNKRYPDLRETPSETERKYSKRAPKSNDVTPSAPTEEDLADPNSKPPRYESIQQKMDPPQSYVHFPGGINHSIPPPTVAANGAWLQYANTFQYPPSVMNPVHMGNEWIDKQISATETLLRDRGFPENTPPETGTLMI